MLYDKKMILFAAIASIAIASASCSHAPIATGCSELARPILTRATPHAEHPSTGDPDEDARVYAIAETGQLNKANDDKVTGFEVINACERRDEENRAWLNRPWYQRLWPG